MEYTVGFLPSQFPNRERFYVEMTGITYPDVNYRIAREHSARYCLEYVIQGKGHVQCGQTFFQPKAGDVYLLPAGLRHNYRSDPKEPYQKIWVNLMGSLVDSLYQQYNLGYRYHYPDCNVYPLFRAFLSMCENNRKQPAIVAAKGALMIHEIFEQLANDIPSGITNDILYARKAKEYIEQHAEEPITVPQIAGHVGLSTSQLNRVFQAEYGVTPHKFYTESRMNLACLLLRNTALQVREIAEQLQFSDEHYFSASFKRVMGITPKQYRMQVAM